MNPVLEWIAVNLVAPIVLVFATRHLVAQFTDMFPSVLLRAIAFCLVAAVVGVAVVFGPPLPWEK
jgi:hypothetical protein